MSYFKHEATPYPLTDHHGDVPNNILIDMALTLDASLAADSNITVLQVTSAFAFIAIEASTQPVAHAYVVNPKAGRLYQFDEGNGWVMFGPGVGSEYSLPASETLQLDPACLIIEPPDVLEFDLVINEVTYPMPNVLNVEADGFLQLRVGEREVYDTLIPGASETIPVIELSRNDAVISETVLTRGLISNPLPPVRKFGEAVPDVDGNIKIIVELETGLEGSAGVYIIPCDNPSVAGFALWTLGVPGCGQDDLLEQLRFSDCGEGQPYELPFDKFLDLLKCGDDPCGPEAPTCT